MFNSTLINNYGSALRNAIWQRQKEIVEFPYGLWLDSDSENEGQDSFDILFGWDFPPGFIRRDKKRAKKVIRDIYDIVCSPTIRYNADAIHCYVMYHLIEDWFDNEFIQTEDLVPDAVKDFVATFNKKKCYDKGLELSGEDTDLYEDDSSEADEIIAWFTDKEICLADFEDTYDPDYMDHSLAEEFAGIYLDFGAVPDLFGVDIKELVDLLPNDLYEKVIDKLNNEEQQSIVQAKNYVNTIWSRVQDRFNTSAPSTENHKK